MSPRQSLQNFIQLHQKADQLKHEATQNCHEAVEFLRRGVETQAISLPLNQWIQVSPDQICRFTVKEGETADGWTFDYDTLVQPPAAQTEPETD